MREIKFRAWGRENEEMVFSGDRPSFSFWKWVDYDSETPLMQYTGLKDKNGKEIYQGDILKWTSWSLDSGRKANKISEVIWNAGAWRLSGNETWVLAIYTNIEVIGNIYENPDLINN